MLEITEEIRVESFLVTYFKDANLSTNELFDSSKSFLIFFFVFFHNLFNEIFMPTSL